MNVDVLRERLTNELLKEKVKLLSPNDRILAEEVYRTCFIDPTVERVFFLAVKSVLVNDALVAQVERIFDVTISSDRRAALYSIEELKKIDKLGYCLRNGYLVHPHPKSYNPVASVADLVAFFTTDAALGISLNYVIVSATKDIVDIRRLNFKQCFDCAHFCGFLRGAPLVDSKMEREEESR